VEEDTAMMDTVKKPNDTLEGLSGEKKVAIAPRNKHGYEEQVTIECLLELWSWYSYYFCFLNIHLMNMVKLDVKVPFFM
jgi:hypothetical protein